MSLAATNHRDYLIDNLKFILICTVVIGHFIEPYIHQANYFNMLFICIYSFHIPVFVFISGYLSKSDNSISAYKNVTSLLIPYLIFCLLWYIRDDIHLKTLNLNILSPTFHLWYLLSLFMWRIFLPAIRSVKHYVVISFIISLIAGFSPSTGNILSLGRTLSLLPFFILGTVCQAPTLHAVHQRKYLAIPGIIAVWAIIYYLRHYHFNPQIIFWADSYHVMGYSNPVGFVTRILLIAVAVLIGISIIVITPSQKTFFSILGSRTLIIYIFHGFFVRSFAVRFPLWNQSLLNNSIIISFPLLLIFLLSLPVVNRFYDQTVGTFSRKICRHIK